jgi:hypothetical protein
MAQQFRAEFAITSPIWVDPKRQSYKALGMRRLASWWRLPQVIQNGLRAKRKGFTQKEILGDALQNGGVLVVKKGGGVVYSQRQTEAGDMAPMADVLAAAEKAL